MQIIDELKIILDKIEGYNKGIEELNKLIKVQNLFGNFANPDKITKSIDSLIHLDYYGWFEDKPNIYNSEDILKRYDAELSNESKEYRKILNFRTIKEIIKKDHLDKYSKCYKDNSFDNILYIDLLIDILREKIDYIIDYINDLQIEEKNNFSEKVRLNNDKLQIVRNRHKSLYNIEEKNEKRINLLKTVNNSLDRIYYIDRTLFVLLTQTKEDLDIYYKLYDELCMMRNELLNFKETQGNKKDIKQISRLISNLNNYLLTNEEKELLNSLLPEETYNSIESSIKSYQPIDVKVKSIKK